MEDNKLNLRKLLKGHECETFYTTLWGNIKLTCIDDSTDNLFPIELENDYSLTGDGKFDAAGEICIFPSKDMRDWNKWYEENKIIVPKVWSDIVPNRSMNSMECSIGIHHDGTYKNYYIEERCGDTQLEKAAIALMKIRQLIALGYGGNITKEEWSNPDFLKFCISFNLDVVRVYTNYYHVAFRTNDDAMKFKSHPENMRLVKDLYMIS